MAATPPFQPQQPADSTRVVDGLQSIVRAINNLSFKVAASALTVTDGTNVVADTTNLLFDGAVVSGATPDAIVTISAGITELTGDVSAGPGSGSLVATLATVNANVGTFTNSTVTLDGKGRVVGAANGTAGITSVSGTAGQITVVTTGTSAVVSLPSTITEALTTEVNQNTVTAFTVENTNAGGQAASVLTNGADSFEMILRGTGTIAGIGNYAALGIPTFPNSIFAWTLGGGVTLGSALDLSTGALLQINGAISSGKSGTAGSLVMGNNTSGLLTLEPAIGVALGSAIATLPANSGTIAELNLTQEWTAGQAVTPTAEGVQAPGGTLTLDFSTSNNFTATFGAGDLTIANPTNVMAGQHGFLTLQQDGGGSRVITSWGGNWAWAGGTPPVLSTAPGARDLIEFFVVSVSANEVVGRLFAADYHS